MRALGWLALVALAGPAAARVDPGGDGPFAVEHATLVLVDASRGRTLTTDVWSPDARAARRFPLVLVAHGNCGSRTNYEFLTAHLASHGFVVAAPDFPGVTRDDCIARVPRGDFPTGPPLDLQFLHVVLHDRAGPAAALARRVRGRRSGVVGHSLGGLAVLDATLLDTGFHAVVALAPAAVASLGRELAAVRPPRAVLAMGGTADTTVPLPITTGFFDALAPPAVLIGITGGTHGGFTDVDPLLTQPALARQHEIVRHYATAFLLRHLTGNRRYARFLTPKDAGQLGDDVALSVAGSRRGDRPSAQFHDDAR